MGTKWVREQAKKDSGLSHEGKLDTGTKEIWADVPWENLAKDMDVVWARAPSNQGTDLKGIWA